MTARKMSLAYLPLAALALMLAACGDDEEKPAKRGNTGAYGDVQPGTISDAMIPLDQLRSQSPPEKIENLPASEGGKPPAKPAEDAASQGGEAQPAPSNGDSSASEAAAPDPAPSAPRPASSPASSAADSSEDN